MHPTFAIHTFCQKLLNRAVETDSSNLPDVLWLNVVEIIQSRSNDIKDQSLARWQQ